MFLFILRQDISTPPQRLLREAPKYRCYGATKCLANSGYSHETPLGFNPHNAS